MREALDQSRKAVTMGQCYADWFSLRRFSITGKLAREIMKRENYIRALIGVTSIDACEIHH